MPITRQGIFDVGRTRARHRTTAAARRLKTTGKLIVAGVNADPPTGTRWIASTVRPGVTPTHHFKATGATEGSDVQVDSATSTRGTTASGITTVGTIGANRTVHIERDSC